MDYSTPHDTKYNEEGKKEQRYFHIEEQELA